MKAQLQPAATQDRYHWHGDLQQVTRDERVGLRRFVGISGPGGAVQPAYDPAGNMTLMPRTSDWTEGDELTWDAWNRLTRIRPATSPTSSSSSSSSPGSYHSSSSSSGGHTSEVT